MTVKEKLAALVKGVKADIVRCEELQKLLRHQERLLTRTDTDGLTHLNLVLTPTLDALAGSARERSSLLDGLGFGNGDDAMQLLLTKLPEKMSNDVGALWQALGQRLSQCKSINERNGHLLASQQELLAEVIGRTPLEYGVES